VKQAPSRTSIGFRSNYFLGDYEGLAAAGNDFVAVWGMPDGSATGQESIFFRRAISGKSMTPSLAVAASAGNTAASLAGPVVQFSGTGSAAVLDPASAVAAGLVGQAASPGPALGRARSAAVVVVVGCSRNAGAAGLGARPARQCVAEPGRAAAHGTPSTVLDRVFADLAADPLADALQESPTPGPTG
jgi:hypothetical protein